MKADYYKGTEKILYNYNYLKANLEIKLKELHEIQLDDGVSGINYEGVSTCKTYKISQPVEDIAVLNLEMINNITQNIKKLKSKINSIEMPLVTKLQDGNIVEIITSELEMLQKLEEWSK